MKALVLLFSLTTILGTSCTTFDQENTEYLCICERQSVNTSNPNYIDSERYVYPISGIPKPDCSDHHQLIPSLAVYEVLMKDNRLEGYWEQKDRLMIKYNDAYETVLKMKNPSITIKPVSKGNYDFDKLFPIASSKWNALNLYSNT